MYLVNKSKGTYEVSLYGSYTKVTLDINKGIKVNTSNPKEVDYYKACTGRGLILLPERNYRILNGLPVNEPKKVEKKVEEPKKPVEAPKEEPKKVEDPKKPEPKVETPKEEPKKPVEEPKKEEPKKPEPKVVKKVVKKKK